MAASVRGGHRRAHLSEGHHDAPESACRKSFFIKSPYPYFWCYETPRVKPALGTRGGTATFPTKAPAFAPRCLASKTCGAWPRFPNPVPRWFFYGGESVGLFFVVLLSWNTRVKREKLFRKNVHYGPTFYTNPALGVGGGGPALHCHRLAWAGSPEPPRGGEVG